jgi:hypothetical protein
MIVRASADPDEMPPAITSASNMLRTVPFNASFERVRTLPAVRVNAAPFAVIRMKSHLWSIVEIPLRDDPSMAGEGRFGGAHIRLPLVGSDLCTTVRVWRLAQYGCMTELLFLLSVYLHCPRERGAAMMSFRPYTARAGCAPRFAA